MVLQTIAVAFKQRYRRIEGGVITYVVGVVVSAEIELHNLGELTDSGREIALEAEVADVDTGYATIRVQLDTRLVAP